MCGRGDVCRVVREILHRVKFGVDLFFDCVIASSRPFLLQGRAFASPRDLSQLRSFLDTMCCDEEALNSLIREESAGQRPQTAMREFIGNDIPTTRHCCNLGFPSRIHAVCAIKSESPIS
jgi:hypothetical protein